MAEAFTLGPMAESTREIMKMIKSMALVYIHGLMGEFTVVNGLMASNTVKEIIHSLMVQ
jgi:hypothetical protein